MTDTDGDGIVHIADGKTPARCSITVADGFITSINLVDTPMYWYANEWHPYPEGDKITIVEVHK
jgi:hypothetical protein